jgi:hypothetical protein
MSLIWERSGQAYYAAVRDDLSGEVRFRLIVERSTSAWDWAAWRPGQDQSGARVGTTMTLHGAIREVERAVIGRRIGG